MDIDHSQEDTSRKLLRVQVVSGGLFFAAAIWGVDRRRPPLPARRARSPSRRPRRRRPPRVQLGLTPFGLSPRSASERNRHRMATLKIQLPGQGTKVYRIHKKLTSLGRGEEADVALPDPSLADSHAAHPLRRARLQPRGHRPGRRDLRQRAQAQQAAAGARRPDPDRRRRAGVLALRPAGRRRAGRRAATRPSSPPTRSSTSSAAS